MTHTRSQLYPRVLIPLYLGSLTQGIPGTMSLATAAIPDGQREIISQTGKPRFLGILRFVYGTAFKGDKSSSLIEIALKNGYVGINTASVTQIYQEKLVSDGIRNVLAKHEVKQERLDVRQDSSSPLWSDK